MPCSNMQKSGEIGFPLPEVYLVYEYDGEDNLADIWVTQYPRFLQKELSSQKLYFWCAHKKYGHLVQNRGWSVIES